MSQTDTTRRALLSADDDIWANMPRHGFWAKLWFWLRFWLIVKTARLRFIAILVGIGAVIAYWDTLLAYYERWTRRPGIPDVVVASDTEYFCPMHPQIVRETPRDKCPLCFMPLSKRKKGDASDEALPPGVVSRVQLSPYRVVLAGVQTWEVAYLPLSQEIHAVGFVEFDERRLARISDRVPGRNRLDRLHVNVTGQMVSRGDPLAELYSPELVTTVQNLLDSTRSGNRELTRIARDRLRLWGIDDDQVEEMIRTGKPITHVTIRSPISGHVIRKYQVEGEYVEEGARLYDVADLSMVWIQGQVYEDELGLLREGMLARATVVAFPGEEFTGRLAQVLPHLDKSTRTVTVRFDVANPAHKLRPGMYATLRLHVPVGQLAALGQAAAEEWRNRLLVRSLDAPGGVSAAAAWDELLLASVRAASLARGLALAVPESSVIDTGSRRIVYRQELPGVYEGVEVQLGPRMLGPDGASYYPVVRGLEAGDHVVTSGSFLIDAETRLNPAAGSIYFGGSSGKSSATTAAVRPTTPADQDATVLAARGRLRGADRQLVEAQDLCVVLDGSRLGSMGPPVKILLDGQPVFLCCKSCEEKARADPAATLAKVARLRAGGDRRAAVPASAEEESEIQAALAKLPPADRQQVDRQRFCAVQVQNRLGSMGPPVKVEVGGQAVYLCCESCSAQAKADAAATLARVARLRAAAGKR